MEFWGILIIFILIVAAIIAVVSIYERKRTEKLLALSERLSMSFNPKDEGKALRNYLRGFRLTSLGSGRKAYNVFSGQAADWQVKVFDYRYTLGSGKSSSTYNQTVLLFESDQLNLPNFKMRPEHIFHRIGNTFGMQDIDFEDYPVFSDQYLLQGKDENAIRNFFDHDVLTLFTDRKGLCVEGDGHKLIIYRNGKRVSPDDIPSFLEEQLHIANRLRAKSVKH